MQVRESDQFAGADAMKFSSEVLQRRRWNQALYNKLLGASILRVLNQQLDPKKLAIDVGGNTGYHCFYMAQHCKRVVTYEPVPRLFQILRENMTLKGMANKVGFRNKAVGNRVEEVVFHVDMRRLSNTSQVPLVESQKAVFPMTKLDIENHQDVGFIKIDVEGFEYDVLLGAQKLIERDRPKCMVEIYKPYCQVPIQRPFEWFFERDYLCGYFFPKRGKLIRVEDADAGEQAVLKHHDRHDGDFLFIPRGSTDGALLVQE